MYKKLSSIAIISLMAIIFGIFSITAFGQTVAEIKQKMEHYDKLAQQWTKYRNESVLPYYNDPTYYRWARSEYQKANKQIANAIRLKTTYQKKYENLVNSKYASNGTETVTQECWVKVDNGPCTYIYGRVLWYDNGNVNRTDYDNKRNQMYKAGYSFKWAKEYSRKRFGVSKYLR